MYSGNSETSEIVSNQWVSCQGGLADTKVFTDNNRSSQAEGLKCGVDVTTSHKLHSGLCSTFWHAPNPGTVLVLGTFVRRWPFCLQGGLTHVTGQPQNWKCGMLVHDKCYSLKYIVKQAVEARRDSHMFWTVGSKMAVRLLALRAGRPLPPGSFLLLISVRGWVEPRAIVRLEGLGDLKNQWHNRESNPRPSGL
jgi:hypothetical protein